VFAAQHPQALAVLLRRCEETGVAPIVVDDRHSIESRTSDGQFCVTFETDAARYENVWLGMRGRHQIDNAAVAIRLAELLRVPHAAIVSGIETTQHPGRLEMIEHKPAFLLDGAHNPAGCQSLRTHLEEFATRPLTLVFGAMRDKQFEQMGEILFPVADVLILTRIENARSASIEKLRTVANRFARGTVIETDSAAEALQIAVANTPEQGLICVAGSLYLIGQMRPSILEMSLNRPT
jgi:dihydrofolate synthase/folylpolyglutamate synthase